MEDYFIRFQIPLNLLFMATIYSIIFYNLVYALLTNPGLICAKQSEQNYIINLIFKSKLLDAKYTQTCQIVKKMIVFN